MIGHDQLLQLYRRPSLVLLVAGLLVGCQSVLDSLLEVNNPGAVLDETLKDPTNASLLALSLSNDFNCAFSNYAMASGLVGEEMTWGDLNTFDYDRRTFTTAGGLYATSPCNGTPGVANHIGVFTSLSIARWMADNAHGIFSGFTDQQVTNRQQLLATASVHEAYSILLLGEAMCEAAIDVGPKLSRRQLWEIAEAGFGTAITEAQAANDAALLNMARVGRARTRINLATNPESPVTSKAAEAVADATPVPDGFVRLATYAATDARSANQIFWWMNEQVRSAIDAPYWNLAFNGVPDRRVTLTFTNQRAHDNVTPLVLQTKYTSRTASMPIARWAEAQLIIAEVQGGQTAVGIINTLHSRAGLPTFASTDPAEIRLQVVQERQRELFLESHHLNDKIRFRLPFLPAAGTPYKPSGAGIYGSMTCFPLPDVERFNNPNLQ